MDADHISYTFSWTIENFSLSFGKCWKDCIRSPYFSADIFNGCKWYISQSVQAVDESRRLLAIYHLTRMDDGIPDYGVSFLMKMKWIDGNGIIIATHQEYLYSHFKKGSRTSPYFLEFFRDRLDWVKNILTVECQLSRHRKRTVCLARTKIREDRTSLIWNINVPDGHFFTIHRPFSFSETSQYEISLTTKENNKIGFQIRKLEEDSTNIRNLNVTISVLNSAEEIIISHIADHLFNTTAYIETWDFPVSVVKHQLPEDVIVNDVISFFCEFSMLDGKFVSDIITPNYRHSNKLGNILTFQHDFVQMFKNTDHAEYSDVKLRTGSVSFPAHKILLTSRSPVFRAMFTHNMIEKQTGVVEISDVDSETMKSFLQFINTGSVDMDDYECALKLLLVADKYQVLDLKKTCSTFISSELFSENVCEILLMADRLNLRLLKESAFYCAVGHFQEIYKSDDWLEYIEKDDKLSKEIISYVDNNYEIAPNKKLKIESF